MIEPINRGDSAVTATGLHIPKAKEQGPPNRGWVRFISARLKNPGYKVGDQVVFNEPQPLGFHWHEKSYIPVKSNQIVGIIDDDSANSV